MDLSLPKSPAQVLEEAERLGVPRILINNAAHSARDGFENLDATTLDTHYVVNLRATALLSVEFARRYPGGPGGRITSMTSGQKKGPVPGEQGYEVLEVEDPSHSGASLERPGMDRVRDLVATGGISLVLAQDRDRFAREPAYHYLLRREFEEHGCKPKALNDRGDDSPKGVLTDGILDQLAKFERAKTAERSRRGKLRKAREDRSQRFRRLWLRVQRCPAYRLMAAECSSTTAVPSVWQ